MLLLGVSACAEILGVDSEVDSVATALCKCSLAPDLAQRWPDQTCEAHVQAALANDDDAARVWLELFRSKSCAECGNAEMCARAEPVCSSLGSPCVASAACCGYDDGDPTEVYCGSEGVCVSDSEACKTTGVPCADADECCGAAGGRAACTNGLCYTFCGPEIASLCPSCCATVLETTTTLEFQVCGVENLTCNNLCPPSKECDVGVCSPVVTSPDQFPTIEVYFCL